MVFYNLLQTRIYARFLEKKKKKKVELVSFQVVDDIFNQK